MSRRFAAHAAARLGLEPHEAAVLLAAMRAAVGRRSYALRAAAFAVATSGPARLLPWRLRRRALVAFLRSLLESPAALNLYAGRRPWPAGEPCAGLVRGA